MRKLLLASSIALVACGAEPQGDDEEEAVNCAEEEADTFVVGFSRQGESGMMTFKIIEATPAPPAKFLNAWTVQIDTVGGVAAPVEGATLNVTPYMPEHMHTSGISPVVAPGAQPGVYEITRINFHMPSVWETTIRATSAAGSDKVVFKFCIPT